MIPPGPLQPIYATLFVVLALAAGHGLLRAGGRTDRVGWALELAMAVSMFVMVFDWGVSRWVVFQSIVFGAGGLWYLARAFGLGTSTMAGVLADDAAFDAADADGSGRIDGDEVAPSAHSSHSPLHLAHHAVMMGAMIWMLIAMIPHGRGVLGHFAMISPRQVWPFMIGAGLSLLLAASLVALTVGWLRGRDRHGRRGYDVAMTAGMFAMVAPMLTL